MQVCQGSASSSIWFLRRRILNIFQKFTIYVLRQPIKLSDMDKSRLKHGGLLNKYFIKKIQISPMTWEKLSISTFPIISLWELYVAIATRVLIRPE